MRGEREKPARRLRDEIHRDFELIMIGEGKRRSEEEEEKKKRKIGFDDGGVLREGGWEG